MVCGICCRCEATFRLNFSLKCCNKNRRRHTQSCGVDFDIIRHLERSTASSFYCVRRYLNLCSRQACVPNINIVSARSHHNGFRDRYQYPHAILSMSPFYLFRSLLRWWLGFFIFFFSVEAKMCPTRFAFYVSGARVRFHIFVWVIRVFGITNHGSMISDIWLCFPKCSCKM